jgi:hypothetical protein
MMAEPENHTLRLLQEIRKDVQSLSERTDKLENKVDGGFARVDKRMDTLQQAMNGESLLGRYAAAEVEERLASIETRLTAVESSVKR